MLFILQFYANMKLVRVSPKYKYEPTKVKKIICGMSRNT